MGGPVHERWVTFASLLEQVPAIIGYWDRDERCRYASPGYADLYGLSPSQVMGMTIAEVLGPEAYALSRPHLDEAFAGHGQDFDRTVPDRAGGVRYLRVSYRPDVVDGEVAGIVLLITDVSEVVDAARALHRSVLLHRATVRSLPDSFVLAFDTAGVVTVADGPASHLFGATTDLVGRRLSAALPDVAADLDLRWPAAPASEHVSWDRVVAGHTMAMRAAPLVDGDVVFGGVVVGTDVTVERRRQTLAEAIQRITAASAGGASLDAVCSLVACEARAVFNAEHAEVSRVVHGHVRAVSVVPVAGGRVPGGAPGPDLSAAERAVRSGLPVLVDRTDAPVRAGSGCACTACGAAAPVVVHGEVWGAVSVGLAGLPADEGGLLSALHGFARAVALAISSAEAWERLEAEASTDHLTGLANRRSFDERLEALVASAMRNGSPVSLVLFDLDDFKAVNDTHGHPAGDEMLRRVAAAASAAIRHGEALARIGGDEFALAMSGDLRAADAAAARIADAIAPVGSASFGTASLGLETPDPSSLLAAADEALYAQKRRRADAASTVLDLS